MGKLTVHGIYFTTCTRRVLMALEEKNADYTFQFVDAWNGEHKTPEYIANKHPFGQVPVLFDDDFRVYESRAICRYIDDITDGPIKLVPKDPKQKALVEQWISVESANYKVVETLVAELVFKKLKNLQPDATVVEENKKKLPGVLSVLNKHLEGRTYLVGDQFTLADLVFMPYTEMLLQTEQFANLFADYPNVDRWWKTIRARPTWQKVLNWEKNSTA